jgi:crotonobetainyl-CoA:carnitine CoA-transferase CaiB-like acyl-CoA transferase
VAPLGARFLAAWLAFFAVLAAWPAVRPARAEARVPLLALIAYGIGGLLAAAVHPGELGPGVGGYVAGLLIVVAVPALVLARGARGCGAELSLSLQPVGQRLMFLEYHL